jgi:hypothetical protein
MIAAMTSEIPESAGHQPGDGVLDLAWQPAMADFTEAFRARNRARKMWYKVLGLVGAALVGAAVASLAGNVSLTSGCIALAAGLPIAVLVVQPVSVRSLWRRNPALRATLRARVDPAAGITLTGESTGQHPWSVVHSFLETDRVFVVQLSGYRALGFILLAKRGLPDQQQVDALRTVLSRATVTSTRT